MSKDIKNKTKAENVRIIMYLVFGALTTAVDWVCYTLLRLAGLNYMLSNIIAWALAVLFAFITNKVFVFDSKSFDRRTIVKELISFVGARVFSLALQLIGIELMVDYIHFNDFIAKAIMTVVVVVSNYVFSKLWIFKK